MSVPVIHIAFARAVLTYTRRLVDQQARQVELVPGKVCALATLLGGVFVAAVYWLLHRSTLAGNEQTVLPGPSPGFEA